MIMAPAASLRAPKPTMPRLAAPRAAGVPPRAAHNQRAAAKALPPAVAPQGHRTSNITPPNRLPSQWPLQLQPRSMPPYGVNPLPAGVQGRPRQQQERRNPIASQRFAPQKPPTNKMRHTPSNPMQNTSTLRRSGSFGFGQQGTQRKVSVATAVYIFSGMPLPRCLTCPIALLPVPKALRPPPHLSKRYEASVGQPPQMRDSVRPLCVQWPQLPPVGRVSAG